METEGVEVGGVERGEEVCGQEGERGRIVVVSSELANDFLRDEGAYDVAPHELVAPKFQVSERRQASKTRNELG